MLITGFDVTFYDDWQLLFFSSFFVNSEKHQEREQKKDPCHIQIICGLYWADCLHNGLKTVQL